MVNGTRSGPREQLFKMGIWDWVAKTIKQTYNYLVRQGALFMWLAVLL